MRRVTSTYDIHGSLCSVSISIVALDFLVISMNGHSSHSYDSHVSLLSKKLSVCCYHVAPSYLVHLNQQQQLTSAGLDLSSRAHLHLYIDQNLFPR